MRRAASIFALLGALAAIAVDPALLMRTHTDRSRMFMVPNVRSVDVMTGFLGGGEEGFTAVAWIRFYPTNGIVMNVPNSLWSIEPARATREGGAELPAIMDYQTVTDNSGGTFADPHYDYRVDTQDTWQYGCYCVNIETPVDVTVTIAGAERFVVGSNGVKQAFNILGKAADYSWSVTGPTGGATPVKFGFAVNPLVKFYGIMCQSSIENLYWGEEPGGPNVPAITNEWTMVAVQARIDNGTMQGRMAFFTWASEIFPSAWQMETVNVSHFEKNARVRLSLALLGAMDLPRDFYGMKVFPYCLSDDELRNVRDLDMCEMQRRGMTRWRAQ